MRKFVAFEQKKNYVILTSHSRDSINPNPSMGFPISNHCPHSHVRPATQQHPFPLHLPPIEIFSEVAKKGDTTTQS